MGWKFNPFTGALDQTGSTPASYIDGEVATYNDLPLSSTTAPLDTAWLVRGSSGVWPFTKPGGVYIRTATGGSSRDADYTYAGIFPDVFSDANFTLYDDGDSTKNAKFQLSGISAGTTRTLTIPNASGTITLDGHTHILYGEIVDSLLDGGEQILADIGAAASSHTHDAANITSGTLANARVNWAAPSALGSTTPAAVSATTLSASGIVTPANASSAAPTTTSGAAGIQFTSLGGGTNQVAVYGSYAGTPTFGIGAGTSAGSLTEIAAFNLNGVTLNRALTVGNGTLTASAPVLDLSQTWNNSAVTFTGLKSNVTATAAASNSMFADIQAGGYSQFGIARISSTSNAVWLYNTNSGTNTNGVGANHERGFMRWSSNVLQIGTEKLGTGSARDLTFSYDGTTRLTINDRVRTGATSIILGSTSRVEWGAATTYLEASTSATPAYFKIVTGSTDRLNFDAAGIIGFGGLTSSFPALKRSSTALQVRLADDSAFAPLECGALTLNGNLTASTRNIVTDAVTGTRIGTATTQLLGFWNAAPSAQPAAVADATDAATVITQLNALLSRLRTIGIIAT